MRVVIADDEALLRDGLAVLLDQAGFIVAGKAADPAELRRLVATERPDAAVIDIKMPPSDTDEGIVAAQEGNPVCEPSPLMPCCPFPWR